MYLIRALGRTRTYDGISTAELQSAPFAAQVTSAYMKIYIEYILMSLNSGDVPPTQYKSCFNNGGR